jgi:hypothetical protein
MRHIVLTLVAISIAAIAAVAATTAMLNTPMRIGPATSNSAAPAQAGQAPAPASKEIPDAPPPKDAAPPVSGTNPSAPADGEPAAAKAIPGAEAPDATPDEDPYEGIAPEELPPDLQYDADASVSFPTNT